MCMYGYKNKQRVENVNSNTPVSQTSRLGSDERGRRSG